MHRPRREAGLATVLFACSGAVAVAITAANVVALAHGETIVRLRDLRLLDRLRSWLDTFDVQLLTFLPSVMSAPFDLRAPLGLARFTALAMAVHVVLFWTAAAIAAPFVTPLARRRAEDDPPWPLGLPLAVIGAALVPVVAHRLTLWTHARTATVALGAVAIVALAWLVAARLLAGPRAARWLVTVCRWVMGVAVIAAAVGIAIARPPQPVGVAPPPPGTPNVLLVSIDTLRPDHLGCYGYGRATSPTIDALAAAGTRFATVVSPTSWTLPAHVSLLTALPPEVHGVVVDGRRLDESVVTLAEVLRARGYATAGFVSGPYLDAAYGYARGFDHYDDYSAVRISRPAVHQAHTSPTLLASLDAWLAERDATDRTRPFFVFLHMWDVHYDFNPPPPYDTMFDPDYRGTVTGDDFFANPAVHPGMDARDLQHLVALYDGEIRYTDAHLGRVIDALRARDVLDQTIVVVTGDHGEEFFEHGKKGHHNALYDESIRVPLVVRYPPRVPVGAVVDAQVRLVDVAPTVLALTDTPAPPAFGLGAERAPYAGQSVLPLLADPTAASRPAFADLEPHGLAAVRHPEEKLIVGPFGTDRRQLFDLRADPGERHDRAATDPTTHGRLYGELSAWLDVARLSAKQAREAAVTEEHKAALKALGYLAE